RVPTDAGYVRLRQGGARKLLISCGFRVTNTPSRGGAMFKSRGNVMPAATMVGGGWSRPARARVRAIVGRLHRRYREAELGNLRDPIDELVYISLTRQTHRQN